jgi:hypothetical protein
LNAAIMSQECSREPLDPQRRIVEFASGASTEITTHDDDAIAPLAAILPPGTVIYVAHTPKATLKDVVRVSRLVQASGLRASPHIVTQFGFDPDAISQWAGVLAQHGVQLPVHPGMAGPAPLTKLVKYAMACGVGASLGSAMRSLQTMKHIAGLATTPEAMLAGLARGAASGIDAPLEPPQVFAFGGVIATARWLRAVIDGRFELRADGTLTVAS